MRLVEAVPGDDLELARALVDLQRAAYTREAELIGDDRIPALHEDLDDLRSAGLRWLTYLDGPLVVGAVGWTENEDEIDIDRLVVAPSMHRRGIGASLVTAVVDRAGTRRVVVSTGRSNVPARRLYEQFAFERIEDDEVIPGLWVTRYVRLPG